jgi:hypothetical protein
MTPGMPNPAKIAEVDGFGQGSGNSTARVREVEGGGQGWLAARRWAARDRRGSWMSCVLSSPWGPLYIGGGGCTLPPPQASPRAATKGGEGGGG